MHHGRPGRCRRVVWVGAVCVTFSLVLAAAAPGDEAPSATKFRALMDAGRYSEAEGVARALLLDTEAREGKESLATASALDLLVESLNSGGRSSDPATRDLADRAVAIKERLLAAEDPGLALSLHNLGVVLAKKGAYPEARAVFDRALAIREAALGPDHSDVAQSLVDVGWLFRNTGDYAAGLPLLERALVIREQALGPNHPDVAEGNTAIALLHWAAGDYAEARRHLEVALTLYEKSRGTGHPLVAQALNNLAIVIGETGDLAAARPYLERSLAIREQTLGPEHPDVGQSVNNLGVLYMHLGEYGRALPLFERGLQIRERALGPDHPDIAQQGLNNIAWALTNLAEIERARPLLDRSLLILENSVGPEHPYVAETLGRLSRLQAGSGDLEGALATTVRTREIREKTLGPAHPYLALTIEEQARLLAVAGDSARALEAALRAEEVSRTHVRLTALTLPERQALRLASQRASGLDVALTLAVEGLDSAALRRVWDSLIRSRALVLDEMAARHHTVDQASDPEVSRLADGLVASRARLASLLVSGPGRGSADTYPAALERANQEKEAAERALALQSAAFRREHEREDAGLEEVRASLPPRSALLAYARFNRIPRSRDLPPRPSAPGRAWAKRQSVPSYAALVLRSDRDAPRIVPLGEAEAIDRLIEAWRREVTREPPAVPAAGRAAEAAARPAGERLRTALWDKVAIDLEGVRQIFVVPDGAIHLVPLAALPVDGSRYLVETGPLLHYLSAERDLVRPDAELRGKGLLVVGNPDFDARPISTHEEDLVLLARSKPAGSRPAERASPVGAGPGSAPEPYRGPEASCGSLRAQNWKPLPGSRLEADEIAALWRRGAGGKGTGVEEVVELTGTRAAEAFVKRIAPGHRVIHLATHGFVEQEGCESALSPAPDREAPPVVSGDNPLLLSGLVLAGANRRHDPVDAGNPEDGLLTAEEIASLDLSGVEWVVLSACDTGVGKAQSGEGVLGLRRAFEIAGAGTLFMTLWQVKDESARQWTRQLYEGRLRALSTAESARRASLRMIDARRKERRDAHPFHWAAFVAAGDWR